MLNVAIVTRREADTHAESSDENDGEENRNPENYTPDREDLMPPASAEDRDYSSAPAAESEEPLATEAPPDEDFPPIESYFDFSSMSIKKSQKKATRTDCSGYDFRSGH
jgi:hypothetical protein